MKTLKSGTLAEANDSEVIYRNPETKQYVLMSAHAINDRKNRPWWKDYNDPNFTEFVRYSLSILHNGFKRKLEGKGAMKDCSFTEREEFAFVSPDRQQALMVSLRPTDGRYNTSFSITTVLNMDSPDMNKSRDIITRIEPNHEYTLSNFQLVTESVNERTIHIIQL
jgi:hypothetical protein